MQAQPSTAQSNPGKSTSARRNWETDPILTVEHLTMRFGGLTAVGDLSFSVGRGDITALIGPNGAGKTTVFNCVTGFYKPTEGRIVMRHGAGRQEQTVQATTATGRRFSAANDGSVFLLERMPDFEISKKAKVARTFQNIRLFGGMTVLENLLVAQHNPLMVASGFTIGGLLGLPSFAKAQKAAIDLAVYWLDKVNLIDRADDPAGDLPYGAQRRLEIARAMCTRPMLLCLDEPAAGLNPRESAELNALLHFIRDSGTSVLLIEHDMGVVMEISDHIVVLDYGVKISDGDAGFVRSDPKVIAAYLGVDDEEIVAQPEVASVVVEALGDAAPKEVVAVAAEAPPATRAKSKTPRGSAPKSAAKSKAPVRAKAAPKPAAAVAIVPSIPDDLTLIKGIGPVNNRKLNQHGVTTFAQIAAWKKADIVAAEVYLEFDGRIEREDWVGQAKKLAKAPKAAPRGKASKSVKGGAK
jgi:branched-chain amino acid transport system ATP-binding protein